MKMTECIHCNRLIKNLVKERLQKWFSNLEIPIYWSLETRDILDDLKETFELEYPK